MLRLLGPFRRIGLKLVAMTGNPDSELARRAEVHLDVSVPREACPLGLAPTASTTAALAMGDALAMAYLEIRGFREEDFAQNHPGGSLGRKLLTTVSDLMHTGEAIPRVGLDASIYEIIREMSGKCLGTTLVVDKKGHLKGIITDGDLRRLIEKIKDISGTLARDFMSPSPKTIHKDNLAAKALQIMEQHSITSLVVTEDGKKIEGILHLQDLLKAGIV